jgi:pilus assembly protein Flp/PilA
MRNLIEKFWRDEQGQGLVEYVLIIALVAIGLISIMLIFRNAIGNVFVRASDELNNAPTSQFQGS